MNWVKKGLIYSPTGKLGWDKNSCLTPTPLDFGEYIRVYFGSRDERGVSRIGYVDLDKNNPKKIIKIAKEPVLDVGKAGCFDDNGVILGDVLKHDRSYYMFYVGFQLVNRVKFLAFSGLAISTDNGETFQRVTEAPILDRSDEGKYIRAIHSVRFENNIWKIWYAAGNSWELIDGQYFPSYKIKYLESQALMKLSSEGNLCIDFASNEYRIGRPRVYRTNDRLIMLYTKGCLDKSYLPGMAESNDGKKWLRCDDELGLSPSKAGWDSETLCYPALIRTNNKIILFYNGNNMGFDGFGYAELDNNYSEIFASSSL